jgi:GntR family transcriptional regulator
LPTNKEVAEQFSVSRNTSMQAFQKLAEEGIVEIRGPKVGIILARSAPGADGTIAAGQSVWADHAAEAAANQDGTTFGTINTFKSAEIRSAPSYVSRMMGLAEGGEAIYRLRERRWPNGLPVMLGESWQPIELADKLPQLLETKDLPGGIARLEDALGKRWERIAETVESVPASDREAEFFGVPVGAPLLQVDHTWFFQNGEPFMFGRGWQPPGRRLTYRLDR